MWICHRLWRKRKQICQRCKRRLHEEIELASVDDERRSNKCQAVVCWNPSQSPNSQYIENSPKPSTVEITELDETGEDVVMDDASNETDENSKSSFPPQAQLQEEPTYGFGLHQWHLQQNSMIPPLPQVSTTPTPITWLR